MTAHPGQMKVLSIGRMNSTLQVNPAIRSGEEP
jgi:hypothetical protein